MTALLLCGKLLKDKLQRFQFRAARVLSGASYDIRSADTIQTLSWDTLDARWLCAKSTLMYKILNDDTAPNLSNSFVRRNADQTDYHLRNSATNLTLPKPKREFLKRSFKYSGAMLWNQLLNEAKLAESIYSFNKRIKTSLGYVMPPVLIVYLVYNMYLVYYSCIFVVLDLPYY